MTIIPYNDSHYQALLNLCIDFKQESAGVSDTFDALAEDHQTAIADYIDQQLHHPSGYTLLAMHQQTPVGFIIGADVKYFPFCQIKRIGHIKELFVAKNHRGRGLCKRLIKTMEKTFYAQGIRHFKIETIVHYPNNADIYKSLGYNTFLLDLRKSV